MPLFTLLRPALPILIGASLMLTLSMGLRQSLGIFLQPLTRDVGISVSDFTLAIAVQNLAWGFLQPLAGAMTVRYGFRAIMVAGAVLYIAGLALMASAHGFLSVMIGAGVLIGMSLACTAAAIAMSVAARAVPETVRSTVLGIVSAAGSLGALLSAPIGQVLNQDFGWRMGLWGFVVLSLAMVPAASTCSAASFSAGPAGAGTSWRCSAASMSAARWCSPGISCCRRHPHRPWCSAPSWASCGSASGHWSRALSPKCSGCNGRR